ncbi:MAG: fumarylacetoacetate hydrolase family protein, partial [Flavobacteriaceae bacterium]|nr:fumarylacetoacetate hydrolase family protein [Flavobacteriaceae bacterium]
ADNASASHYVLGKKKLKLIDVNLEGCKMVLKKNDEITSEGQGSACLGNPLNAALWLAKTMIIRNNPLKKGDVLLTGALGPMTNIEQGDTIEASIEGFDTIKVKFI